MSPFAFVSIGCPSAPPAMLPLRVGHALHFGLSSQYDRQSACLSQHSRIGLEPARRAAARQPAIRHDNICSLTRCSQSAFAHDVTTSAHQHAPAAPFALKADNAELWTAPCTGPLCQGQRIAFDTNQFQQVIACIVTARVTQNQQPLVFARNSDVASIT